MRIGGGLVGVMVLVGTKTPRWTKSAVFRSGSPRGTRRCAREGRSCDSPAADTVRQVLAEGRFDG